ncbi:MAG: hypothetical protein AAF672_00185 [Pseudomonadota bacterium]
MSTPNEQQVNGRLRRPKPIRTEPRRNILGAFLQNGERGGDKATETASRQTGLDHHPLGLQPDAETGQQPHLTSNRNQQDIAAAANVIDRHIRDGKQYEIPVDDGMWGRFSSLASGVSTEDLADMAKLLTRSYSELATVWIEIAGKLREVVGSGAEKAQSSGTGGAIAPPALVIQSAVKVSAKVQMFAAGAPKSVQPLMQEAGDKGLTGAALTDGQIEIFVPQDAQAGRYHGLILGADGAPLGAVTLTVPGAA